MQGVLELSLWTYAETRARSGRAGKSEMNNDVTMMKRREERTTVEIAFYLEISCFNEINSRLFILLSNDPTHFIHREDQFYRLNYHSTLLIASLSCKHSSLLYFIVLWRAELRSDFF